MRNAILILCALGLTACGSKTWFLNLSPTEVDTGDGKVEGCECKNIEEDKLDAKFTKASESKPHYVWNGASVEHFADDTDNHKYCTRDKKIPTSVCKPAGETPGGSTPGGGGGATADPEQEASADSKGGGQAPEAKTETQVASYYLLAGYPQGGGHLAEACKNHFGINNVGTFVNHRGSRVLCGADQQKCHSARNTWLKSSKENNWECPSATQTKPAAGGCVYSLSITTWTCTRTVNVGS